MQLLRDDDDWSPQMRRYFRLVAHMDAVRRHWHVVVHLKTAIHEGEAWTFKETWQPFPYGLKRTLWIAPKYGGIWTTDERKKIRSWGL